LPGKNEEKEEIRGEKTRQIAYMKGGQEITGGRVSKAAVPVPSG